MTLLRIALFFAAIALASARTVGTHYAEEEGNSLMDLAVEDTQDAGHPLPDNYNDWVDGLIHAATRLNSTADIESILSSLTSLLVSTSTSSVLDGALHEPFIHQCGVFQYNERAAEIESIRASRHTCLKGVQERVSFSPSPSGSLETSVASQLLCQIAPEVLSCFEDTVSFLLSCTNHAKHGMPVYRQFRDSLLKQYCTNEETPLEDLISSVPATCTSHGVDYFLKFIGPSFIKTLPVLDPIEYPCAISQYIRQVSSVILKMQCDASSLVDQVTDYARLFNKSIKCSSLYNL